MHSQGAAKAEQRVQHSLLAARGVRGRGQLGVQLHHFYRQAHQVIQRCQARSEFVESHTHTAIHKPLQDGHRRIGALVHHRLRHLKQNLCRVGAAGIESSLQLRHQVHVVELLVGQIDAQRDFSTGRRIVPAAQLPANGFHGLTSQCDRKARLLGHREQVGEVVGRAVSRTPTQQALERFHFACLQTANRLIAEIKKPLLKAVTQLALALLLAADADFKVLVEDFVTSAAGLLGAIHRKVGVTHQQIGCNVVGTCQGRPDTCTGLHKMAKDIERARHLSLNAPGHRLKSADVLNIVDQDGKLVAAQPRGRVVRTKRRAQPIRGRNQHHVSCCVSQNVVDLLEAVKIEKQHAAALLRTPKPPGHGLPESVHENCSVRQTRQHVVHGVVLQTLFSMFAVADIAEGVYIAHPCAVHQQRRAHQAHVHKLPLLVGAHGLHRCAAMLIHSFCKRRMLVEARLRHNQFAQAAAACLLSRVSEHLRERGIRIQDVIVVFDGNGLWNTGQHVFHQARLGGTFPSSEMGNDHRLAQFRIENAVGALNGLQFASLGGHGRVKRAAFARALEQCLRLSCAGKQSPQHVFNRPLHPLTFRQTQSLPRFGIGEDNFSGALKKDKNRQCIQNLSLSGGVGVFRKIHAFCLPGNRTLAHSPKSGVWSRRPVQWLCRLSSESKPRAHALPSPKSVRGCNQSPNHVSFTSSANERQLGQIAPKDAVRVQNFAPRRRSRPVLAHRAINWRKISSNLKESRLIPSGRRGGDVTRTYHPPWCERSAGRDRETRLPSQLPQW